MFYFLCVRFHFTMNHDKKIQRDELGQGDRACESLGSQQGGAFVSDREASVSCGQDAVSRTQEEPAPILFALCVGKSRYVFEGGKADGVLHDNGISVPFFPNFPDKMGNSGRNERNRGMILHFLHGNL